MEKDLQEYIKTNIFPKYEVFYSHGMIHINSVIKNITFLANYYNLNEDMAYVIAAYHDLGLKVNRKNHELESGKIFDSDNFVKKYFDNDKLKIMKEAIEDHRGSRKERPRNIYGEILSDSDRDFEVKILAKRQLATSIKNYPDFDDFDAHFENCYNYILNRINEEGHFNLWTNNPILVERRNNFEVDFFNKYYTRTVYENEWNKIISDGTFEKILNYYLDY